MSIDLRALRAFVAVADHGHVTRAAESLGMQQPPLSQRIRAIERDLGVQLLRRQGRGIALTDAGRVFRDQARATLAQFDQAVQSAQRAGRGELGRLSIGLPPTAPFHPLVQAALRSFRQGWPLVELNIEESLRGELLAGLDSGRFDIAFVRANVVEPEGISIRLLGVEPMVVALPAGDPLAKGTGVRGLPIGRLRDQPFIAYARELGPAMWETTLASCLAAGFEPRVAQQAPRVMSALCLVAAGLGVALVPASMRVTRMDGVVYRALQGGQPPSVALGIASRRANPSITARRFVDLTVSLARRRARG